MKSLLKNRPVLVIVIIVVLISGYFWYRTTQSNVTHISYVTVPAEKNALTVSVSGSGNLIVDQLATVDPTISGTVSGLAVDVGKTVTKGQYLFTIVNSDLTVSSARAIASLQQSANTLESAKLQVKQAKVDYTAAKKDGLGKTTSEKEIYKKKITIAEDGLVFAQKSYNAALADYWNQQSTAAERKVVAPLTGTVNAVNIKNGDDLSRLSSSSASQAPIIIGDLKTIKAQVQVNEVDIPHVTIGQKVMMTFSAIDDFTVSGKVEKMDSLGTITQGVVNYNVTISLDTLDSRLRPGMTVIAKIITGVKQDVITVPNSALKVQGNKTILEVLNQNTQQPEQRTIEIGSANNTDTEIISGVKVGEDVVTQTIDPNAKTTTTSGNSFRLPGIGGGGR